MWRRLRFHRYRTARVSLVPQRDDVFQNGTPVSNPWLESLLFNGLIYFMSMGTGYAIADWLDHRE